MAEEFPKRPRYVLERWTPYLVLGVSLFLTTVAMWYLSRAVETKDAERFQRGMRASTDAVQDQITSYLDLLRSTRGLLAAGNGRISRKQFHTFVSSLEADRHHRGMLGVGYAVHLTAPELPLFQEVIRRTDLPRFKVFPPGPRSEYQAILYLEPPTQRNREAIGFDMASEPVRREAMLRACEDGVPTASGIVTLIQETGPDRPPGFLIYQPLFRKGAATNTPAARRAALTGYVYIPFRAGDLFGEIRGPRLDPGIAFEVYDGPAIDEARLLYRSEELAGPKSQAPRITEVTSLMVGGRQWTFRYATTPRFEAASSSGIVSLILVGGLIISLLLFTLSLMQARAREEAVRNSEELRQSGEALKAANRSKDEFLAMLGHELRNPLGAISNALQMMSACDIRDPRLRRARAVMERQIRHQTRLIEDLLDVARVNSGKVSLRREVVDLSDVARRACDGLGWAVEEQRHSLRIVLPEAPLPVDGDPVRLEQVVTNLLHNSVKYTPPGGWMELTAGRSGEEVWLSVKDGGVGIAPEMQGRIFEVFTQAQISIDRAQGGLGLGLTLVRNLVLMHGGSVEARSEGVGRGSEFLIRLPLASERMEDREVVVAAVTEQLSPPSEVGSTETGGAVRRVLIIEDIRDARETLQELLELLGYQVETAEDGERGLELLRSSPPDVALVDIGLPGLSGYEVAERFRSGPNGAGVRLVALTGYGQPEDRERALRAGFDAHVVKPIDPEELGRLLSA
jgi:signal transduction histidine kinase